MKKAFIVDELRNMLDFLHRTGRVGESGKVAVFGETSGRGLGNRLVPSLCE